MGIGNVKLPKIPTSGAAGFRYYSELHDKLREQAKHQTLMAEGLRWLEKLLKSNQQMILAAARRSRVKK